MNSSTPTAKFGFGLSIFLTLCGVGVIVLGAALPHVGVLLTGALLTVISGLGVIWSVKS